MPIANEIVMPEGDVRGCESSKLVVLVTSQNPDLRMGRSVVLKDDSCMKECFEVGRPK